jgi:putative zinc finger/helix-turn-helix YgiT family protein
MRHHERLNMKNNENCPICGKAELAHREGEFRTEFEDSVGITKQLVVPGISWLHCGACGEDLLDDEASTSVSTAQRRAMGLLTAEEIRSFRNRLDKTQSEMSTLLGIGEKTYCRWESGTYFQSEAFDRYLRLLQIAPENLLILDQIRLAKQEREPAPAQTQTEFRYLRDPSVYEVASIRFLGVLMTGPFQV